MNKPELQAGFTFLEILVVLALLVFIFGFGLIFNLNKFKSTAVQGERDLLWGVLSQARARALANINQTSHGVHFNSASATYTLFQGSSYAGRDASKDVVFEGNSSYTVSGSDVVFNQLSGAVSSDVLVTLDDHINPVFKLCINKEGLINEQTSCP